MKTGIIQRMAKAGRALDRVQAELLEGPKQ